jgi:hypothetical protein
LPMGVATTNNLPRAGVEFVMDVECHPS